MHPLLRPLIDRRDVKFLYTAMVVKGTVFFIIAALVFFLIVELAESYCKPLVPFLEILSLSNSLNNGTASSFPFLSILTPLLIVVIFNLLRPSYWKLKKRPLYCIWKASGTLERWIINESGSLTEEDKLHSNAITPHVENRRLARFVLDNDKVYIGIVLSVDLDNGGITHAHVAPYYSGYLDNKKQLVIEERYSTYYRNLIQEIRSTASHLKEDGLYAKLFREFSVMLCIDNVVLVSSYSRQDHIGLDNLKKIVKESDAKVGLQI